MKKGLKPLPTGDILLLMQKLLWYNEKYQLFFSKRKTNNPNELYCFFLDIKTGIRKHGKYKVYMEDIYVEFVGGRFKVKHLFNMQRYDIYMIQTINVENDMDYINWCGIDIPTEKGQPYVIK